MKVAVVILGLLSMVRGQTTNVQQCIYQSNASTLPLNTVVQGCINPPCQIPQLDSMSIEIFFRSPRLIRSMVTHAHAYILGPIGTGYDLGDEAITCNFITNTYCPLMEGEVIRYQLAMYIESWMAAGTAVTVEFVIRDEADGSPIMCIRVPIRIIAPVNRLAHQTNPAAVAIAQQTNPAAVAIAQQTNSTAPVVANA